MLLKIKPRLTGNSPDAAESSAMALTNKNNRCHAQRGCLVEVYARKIADSSWELLETVDSSSSRKGSGKQVEADLAVYDYLDFLSNKLRKVRVKALPDDAAPPPESSFEVSEALALDQRMDAIEAVSFRFEAAVPVASEVPNGVNIDLGFNAESEPVMVFVDDGGEGGLTLIHSDEFIFDGDNINFANKTVPAGSDIIVARWTADPTP